MTWSNSRFSWLPHCTHRPSSRRHTAWRTFSGIAARQAVGRLAENNIELRTKAMLVFVEGIIGVKPGKFLASAPSVPLPNQEPSLFVAGLICPVLILRLAQIVIQDHERCVGHALVRKCRGTLNAEASHLG